mgnify:CR=1 FL=1
MLPPRRRRRFDSALAVLPYLVHDDVASQCRLDGPSPDQNAAGARVLVKRRQRRPWPPGPASAEDMKARAGDRDPRSKQAPRRLPALGAELAAWKRGPGCIESLPADYDVVPELRLRDDDATAGVAPLAPTRRGMRPPSTRCSPTSTAALAPRRVRQPARLDARSIVARAAKTRPAGALCVDRLPNRVARYASPQRPRATASPVGLAVRLEHASAVFEHTSLARPGAQCFCRLPDFICT